MRIHFLGTGTSTGVPQLGCQCKVCTSNDPRDVRLRTSAMLEVNENLRMLIDCGPDFRQQMLNYGFRAFQAVLLTHEHYDHVGGLDDLRPYSLLGKIPVYADCINAKHLRERLPYCFAEKLYPGVPQIDLRVAEPGVPFYVEGVEVLPLLAYHGKMSILCYRIGDLAYLTDVSTLPAETMEALKGVSLLVINALRHEPHHSHQTLEQAVEISRLLAPKETYFIHMAHQIGLHADVERALPENMHLAYDGLEVSF